MEDSLTKQSYISMMKRCYQKSYHKYITHGGRGIKVCDKWKESFDNFLNDMGPRPNREYTIERIDNDKGYELNNCRWATRLEQSYNRSNSRWSVYLFKDADKYSLNQLENYNSIPALKLIFDDINKFYPLSKAEGGIRLLNVNKNVAAYAILTKNDTYLITPNQQIGKWTVIEPALISKRNELYWKCKCECGTVSSVREDKLITGRTKSCGCKQRIN